MLDNNRKRARSEDEKAGRRDAILTVARDLILESGFEAVTMADVAARASLAKGTLYLYFRTKEELFLALFVRVLRDVIDRVAQAADRHTLVDSLTDAAAETPLFLDLFARLTAVIEANVADVPLFEAKRAILAEQARVASILGRTYGLEDARAEGLTFGLLLVMQGAAQFDLTARRDPATLPDDLRPVFALHAFRDRFPPAARMMLDGALRDGSVD